MTAAAGRIDAHASPQRAMAELLDGNRRFVAGAPEHPNQDAARRSQTIAQQRPFAVCFGCSDSRLAAEIIFDRGLGDLFVVRTAGHVLGPETLGSIEYGVSVLGVPLVVVLGHDQCGAVSAAATALRTGQTPAGHLGAVVDGVAPSLQAAFSAGLTSLDRAGELHVQRTAKLIADRSPLVSQAVAAGRCRVVGLWYRLEAGEVRTTTGKA